MIELLAGVSLLAYVVASIGLVPIVAIEKDRNPFAWLALALVCTPLLALIALAALPGPPREAEGAEEERPAFGARLGRR